MFKTKKFWIIATSIILVVATFCLVGCDVLENLTSKEEGVEENNESQEPVSANYMNIQPGKSSMIKLSVSEPEVGDFGASGDCVYQVIEATITPASAENKRVNWSIAWEDSTRTDDLSQYLMLAPVSDGSTQAVVACYAPFTGNAVITVVAEAGGFTATCTVSFIGRPTEYYLETTAENYDGAYRMGPNAEYTHFIKALNPFGQVASGLDYSVSFQAYGTVFVGDATYNDIDGYVFDTETVHEVEFSALLGNFINFDAYGDRIVCRTLKAVEAYVGNVENGSGVRFYDDKFYEYGEDCYIIATIYEYVTDTTYNFTFKLDQGAITNISINPSSVRF